MTPRARAARAAAALGAAAALALQGCGDRPDQSPGPSAKDVQALVAAGLAAAGSDAAPSDMAFTLDRSVLRVRVSSLPARGPLPAVLVASRGVRARIDAFCPKPAILRCRPALRAWLATRARPATAVLALRRLARRSYGERTLAVRKRRLTRLVTANGELLAAVRGVDTQLTLSFGGLPAPRRRAAIPAGRLLLDANADALAALRPVLPPHARRALMHLRRLIVSAALPGRSA